MHNLFFALRPDQKAAGHIAFQCDRQRLRHGLSGRPVGRDCLHISLNPLGVGHERPWPLIARASKAVSTIPTRPFVVALDRVVSFQNAVGRRPLVLTGEDGVIGVCALYSAIHQALADALVVRRPEPSVIPHVTMLRDRRATPEEFVTPVRWWVREFVLIDSLYGESRHEVLGRWPLIG